MGTPIFAKEILRSLLNIDIDIICVVSKEDKIQGRKKIKFQTPVKQLAVKNNILVLQPKKIIDIKTKIEELKPDFIITCAYGQFIPNSILKIPKNCINIHASLLPKLRGGAPIHWAIINGEKYSGITLMQMSRKMDSGAIYLQKKVKIESDDTMLLLQNKLIKLSKLMIENDLINVLNGKYIPIDQEEKKATFAYNIKRFDEKIDINSKVVDIYNKIKGLYDSPIAYMVLGNKIHKIHKAVLSNEHFSKNDPNGKIILLDKKGIHVKFLDGVLIIEKLQIAGKKANKTFQYYKSKPKDIKVGLLYE